MGTLTVVGQGLAGTLAALAAEASGREVVVVDRGSGDTASRAAAGLFNPLTGPRFSPAPGAWDGIVPFYRNLEQRLGAALVHPLSLVRPLAGAKVGSDAFPRSGPGWTAWTEPGPQGDLVRIEGGGWLDIPALLDAARNRWRAAGRLEERWFDPEEALGREVWWCGGFPSLNEGPWAEVVRGRWQPVRGDVLTVEVRGREQTWGEIGSRFLLPLGDRLFRWGATHESDVDDRGFRAEARKTLEDELAQRWGTTGWRVTAHAWGVRPASRGQGPLVEAHPDHPEWTLFNGFGGRGVSLIPLNLGTLGISWR